MVAAGLSAVGITKDRAQAVAQAVGLRDCGCAERQRRLNELEPVVPTLNERIKDLEATLEQLEDEKAQLAASASELASAVKMVEEERRALVVEIDRHRATIDTLTRHLQTLRDSPIVCSCSCCADGKLATI
jgi:chromosome segregation ATPase